MLDFFDSLIFYVETVWEYISGFITSSISFFGIVFSSVSIPMGLSGYLPTFLGSMVSTLTAVAVVKAIFGR